MRGTAIENLKSAEKSDGHKPSFDLRSAIHDSFRPGILAWPARNENGGPSLAGIGPPIIDRIKSPRTPALAAGMAPA
jgi:hypothetical protein